MTLAIVEHGPSTTEKPQTLLRRDATRLPWAWDALRLAIPFNDPTGESARDLVTNVKPSAVTGLTWRRDNRGNAAAGLGVSSYIEYADTPAHNKPTTAITVYARLKRVGTGDAYSGVFAKRLDAADPYLTWAIMSGGDGLGLAGHLSVGGSPFFFEPGGAFIPTTTEWVSIFLRWRSGTNPRLDLLNERGRSLANASHGSAATGTLTYASGEPVRVNANESATSNYNADYSQCMLWSRYLSSTELQALVADPFGWYSPRRETVLIAGPLPVVYATTYHVYGYAMFATDVERDDLRAELQAWLDAHPGAATGAAFDVEIDGTPVTLAAGMTDLPLMDSLGGGPWDGLTWAYDVPSKEHRDSFGTVPSLAGTYDTGALEGSFFGEATE